jgi:hypothetical protein
MHYVYILESISTPAHFYIGCKRHFTKKQVPGGCVAAVGPLPRRFRNGNAQTRSSPFKKTLFFEYIGAGFQSPGNEHVTDDSRVRGNEKDPKNE